MTNVIIKTLRSLVRWLVFPRAWQSQHLQLTTVIASARLRPRFVKNPILWPSRTVLAVAWTRPLSSAAEFMAEGAGNVLVNRYISLYGDFLAHRGNVRINRHPTRPQIQLHSVGPAALRTSAPSHPTVGVQQAF